MEVCGSSPHGPTIVASVYASFCTPLIRQVIPKMIFSSYIRDQDFSSPVRGGRRPGLGEDAGVGAGGSGNSLDHETGGGHSVTSYLLSGAVGNNNPNGCCAVSPAMRIALVRSGSCFLARR